MKNYKYVLIGLLSTLCLTSPVYAIENAKLSINKNNIKVWTIHNPQKKMMSYRAETTLNTSIERAVALVLDVEHAQSWVPNVAYVNVLSEDLENGDFKLYMVLDFPFPLKDRDLIVQGKMSKDANGQITIKNKAIQQGMPLNPDYIRLKNYEGDWFFQSVGKNKVKVSTSGFADPEGAIPQTVTNLFVQQQPYQMLRKMKTEIEKPNKKLPDLPKILK